MVIGARRRRGPKGRAARDEERGCRGDDVRRTVLTLPLAPFGPENPLPPLRPLDETHTVDERERDGLPADMARQIGYAPLRSVLPVRVLDGYGRERTSADLDAIVIENDRLRATVLPGLGGRDPLAAPQADRPRTALQQPGVPAGRLRPQRRLVLRRHRVEHRRDRPHHALLRARCTPRACPRPTAARCCACGSGSGCATLPFQVDLWLPEGSDFLYVGVRIRNPHDRTAPVYWWSNIAVPEDAAHPGARTGRRGLALRRTSARCAGSRCPSGTGADRTYPLRSEYPADYFYEVPHATPGRWIASLDEDGPRARPDLDGPAARAQALRVGRRARAGGAGRSG